ncbi:MAG TPA: phage portal protein, partial [Pyrinomonadaceae bacterium]
MSANIAVISPTARPDVSQGVSVNGQPVKTAGMGGAYEGADRLGRELASWSPRISSADGALGRSDKVLLDARGHDLLRNSGPMQSASYVHQDSIVGGQWRLNAKPDFKFLGLDETWAEEFQAEVESLWASYAENDLDFWADATRTMTMT